MDKNGEIRARTERAIQEWNASDECRQLDTEIQKVGEKSTKDLSNYKAAKPSLWTPPVVLLNRSFIKSYRDVMAYGIRIAMYLGLALLMGTVFLRFHTEQQYIQPYINAIFFGSAFMSFMAVAYVPAFLEDLHTFKQERANGLVGPLSFMVSNFIIGLPFLFLITLLFSVIEYWMSNFRPSGDGFFTWVAWLFLDLVAAESLVVLVSSIFDVFVISLAVTAFANGLWMCVDGFLVPMGTLNAFWKYVFHYIDYQAYVFQGMMVNELKDRVYECAKTAAGEYQCSYPSSLNAVGKIAGADVLTGFDIKLGLEGTWFGIMIGIIAGYRLLAYLTLVLRK